MLHDYYQYFSKVQLATDQSSPKKEKYKVGTSDKNRKYYCKKCGIEFSNENEYRKHMQKYHSKDNKPVPKKEKDVKICKFCEEKFNNKNKLNEHLATIHPATYECIFCQEIFKNPHMAHSHLKQNHSQILIEKNGGTYPNLRKRRRYLRMKWTCIYCGDIFIFQDEYKYHFRNHLICLKNGVRCLLCDELFPTILKCRQHILEDHDFAGKEHLIDKHYRKRK